VWIVLPRAETNDTTAHVLMPTWCVHCVCMCLLLLAYARFCLRLLKSTTHCACTERRVLHRGDAERVSGPTPTEVQVQLAPARTVTPATHELVTDSARVENELDEVDCILECVAIDAVIAVEFSSSAEVSALSS
jgi:hypothetical protein